MEVERRPWNLNGRLTKTASHDVGGPQKQRRGKRGGEIDDDEKEVGDGENGGGKLSIFRQVGRDHSETAIPNLQRSVPI